MMKTERLRLGVIGLGARGASLIRDVFNKMKNVTVTAVCDVYEDRNERAKTFITDAGIPAPFCTTDYREVVDKKRVDLVVVATPWASHVEIAVYCMEQGMPCGMEVGGAHSLDDCFSLVSAWERTKTPFMFMENCNYGRRELMLLNMVRQGVFGRVVHCDGGYLHDLRSEIAFGKENRHYRLGEYLTRNCENYPTHELGPIMRILDIGKSNRFVSLTAFAGGAFGLHDYVLRNKPDDKELQNAVFAQSDVFTTFLRCANGETVRLTLDTTLPRYYSRGLTVRGTAGMYEEKNDSIILDGMPEAADEFCWKKHWGNAADFEEKYEHELWREYLKNPEIGGHGGMDYLVYNDYFESVREGRPMPIDVYDAAVMMCISPLSARSAAEGGTTLEIPLFSPHITGGSAV